MSHPPSTPVKVPASAATYTPATLDPDLRSQINTLLLREGYINKIQDHLLHTLNSHSSNWPSAVQTHALSLLRSGEVSTFPALIRRVLEDVRHDSTSSASAPPYISSSASTSTLNGDTSNSSKNGSDSGGAALQNGGDINGSSATTNGSGNNRKAVNGATSSAAAGGGGGGGGDLAIPAAVVEAVLKVARESLEAVCEVDEAADGG